MPSASRHHPTWCSSVHLGRSKYFWTVRAQAPMVPARQTIFFQILGTMIWPQVTSSKNCDQKDVFRSMGLKYLVEIDLGFYPIMRLTDFVRLIWSSRTIPFLTSRSLINFLFNYYSHFSITRKNSHKTQTKQTNRCSIQTKHYPTPRDKDNTKYFLVSIHVPVVPHGVTLSLLGSARYITWTNGRGTSGVWWWDAIGWHLRSATRRKR